MSSIQTVGLSMPISSRINMTILGNQQKPRSMGSGAAETQHDACIISFHHALVLESRTSCLRQWQLGDSSKSSFHARLPLRTCAVAFQTRGMTRYTNMTAHNGSHTQARLTHMPHMLPYTACPASICPIPSALPPPLANNPISRRRDLISLAQQP